MKKIVALCLVLLNIFLLCGCNDRQDVSEDDFSTNITYYMSIGKIQEADFALGTLPEEVENTKLDSSHIISGEGNHDHEQQIVKEEGNVSYHYIYGPFHYYYNKGKESDGLSFVVSFDQAYGFSAGLTTKFEIKDALKGLEATERPAESNDQFFMIVELENCEMLIYEHGKYQLAFYFTNDTLVCTTLQNTDNWSVTGSW